MNITLTVDELEAEIAELTSILSTKGLSKNTKLYQAEYFPSFFEDCCITLLISDVQSSVFFTSSADALHLDLELERLQREFTPLELEARFEAVRLHRQTFGYSPWLEQQSLSTNNRLKFADKIRGLDLFTLKDVKGSSADGISYRGKIIELGGKSSSFLVGATSLAQDYPSYHTFLCELLLCAKSNLVEERSVQSVLHILQSYMI